MRNPVIHKDGEPSYIIQVISRSYPGVISGSCVSRSAVSRSCPIHSRSYKCRIEVMVCPGVDAGGSSRVASDGHRVYYIS